MVSTWYSYWKYIDSKRFSYRSYSVTSSFKWNTKTLDFSYLNYKKFQINMTNIPEGITSKYMAYQLKLKSLIFSHRYFLLNISVSKSGIEYCHRLGKFNTIVRFINRRFCKDALDKSLSLISALIIQDLALMLRISYL